MVWIESLSLYTWMIQIFAGNPEIFAAIALMVITSMAAMFRMNIIGLFLMIGMFLILFMGVIDSVLFVMMAVIGGLILGYLFYQIFVRK